MSTSPLDCSLEEMTRALSMSFPAPNPLWAFPRADLDKSNPCQRQETSETFPSASSRNFVQLNENEKGKNTTDNNRPVKKLQLRAYQEELAQAALLGKNSIVVAPTGSGKTWVAVKIILDHLNRTREKKAKVAFLVPTVPLVSQQSEVLVDHLGKGFSVCAISGGETDAPKGTNVSNSDVTVITPQCLVNMISNPCPEDLINVWDFSLIVFDECHHCDQKHPYMEFMIAYLDLKMKKPSELPEGCVLPQTVGLTASLGVGGGENLENAVQHIIKMGAHLDAEYISTVDKTKDDLENYVNVPRDELITVEFDQPGHAFAIHLFDKMDSLERKLYEIIDELIKMRSPIMVGIKARPFDKKRMGLLGRARYEEAYAGWIGALLSKAALIQDKEKGRLFMSYLENLKIYQQALDLHAHLPLQQAVNWLRSRMSEYDTRLPMMNAHELNLYEDWKSLEGRFADIDIQDNKLLRKLIEIIRAQFNQQEDSRVIIFVKTRDLTRELQRALLNEYDLAKHNPNVLTSVNVKGEKGGQSMGDQAATLEDFRVGRCRILAATTVAEEGLDIEKCNLIIKYNSVSSEIAMVQKRGRGRASGSRSIMLTSKGSVADKEMTNMLKEKLMLKALDIIKEEGHRAFRTRVEKVEKFEFDQRRLDEKMLESRRKELGNKLYNLHCKHCSAFLCQSNQIRKVQNAHFVIVDSGIWDRVHINVHRKSRVLYQLAMPGELSCKNCPTSLNLGNVIKYRSTMLPTLRAYSIKIVGVDDEASTKVERQWKGIEDKFFVVSPITLPDLQAMFDTLAERSRKILEDEIAKSEARQREIGDIGMDED